MGECPLIKDCYVYNNIYRGKKRLKCLGYGWRSCRYYNICRFSDNPKKCTMKLFITAFKKALGDIENG